MVATHQAMYVGMGIQKHAVSQQILDINLTPDNFCTIMSN